MKPKYELKEKVIYKNATISTGFQTIDEIKINPRGVFYKTKERPCDGWYKESELRKYFKKPSLGIIPLKLFYKIHGFKAGDVVPKEIMVERLMMLCQCIYRRVENKDLLDEDWLAEYNKLIEVLEMT